MMTRLVAAAMLVVCAAALWGAQGQEESARPISAAEAEQVVTETRDFVTDLLWENTEQYWHRGEWDECIRLCRQIVQIDPHFTEAYTSAAYLLWSSDRDDEALALYEAGIAANPDDYGIYHDLGMYHMHAKEWDKAAEQFRNAVEKGAPMYFQHMLPNALERGGHKQEALEEWRAIVERFPEDQVAKQHAAALEQELSSKAEPER